MLGCQEGTSLAEWPRISIQNTTRIEVMPKSSRWHSLRDVVYVSFVGIHSSSAEVVLGLRLTSGQISYEAHLAETLWTYPTSNIRVTDTVASNCQACRNHWSGPINWDAGAPCQKWYPTVYFLSAAAIKVDKSTSLRITNQSQESQIKFFTWPLVFLVRHMTKMSNTCLTNLSKTG